MAVSPVFRDVAHLINAPEYPNSVRWAHDGTLAVADGNCIVLLHPSDFGGARAFAATEGWWRDDVIGAPGDPAAGVLTVHHGMTLYSRLMIGGLEREAAQRRDQSRRPNVETRSITWSPMGVATAGGCLLAAVTNDYRILVFGGVKGLTPEWAELLPLHEDLLELLNETNWHCVDEGSESVIVTSHRPASLPSSQSNRRKGRNQETKKKMRQASEGKAQETSGVKEGECILELTAEASTRRSDSLQQQTWEDTAAAGRAIPTAAATATDFIDDEVSTAAEQSIKGQMGDLTIETRKATRETDFEAGPSPSQLPPPHDDALEEPRTEQVPKADVAMVAGYMSRRKAWRASRAAQTPVAADPMIIEDAAAAPTAPPDSATVFPSSEARKLEKFEEAAGPRKMVGTEPEVAMYTANEEKKRAHKRLKYQLALSVLPRFFEMRRAVDPATIPVYTAPGMHLKDVDKTLLEVAIQEVSAANAAALEASDVNERELSIETRVQLRLAWDRVRNTMKPGFELVATGLGPGGMPGPDGDTGPEHGMVSLSEIDDDDEEREDEKQPTGSRKQSQQKKQRGVHCKDGKKGRSAEDTYCVPEGFTWRDLPPVDTSSIAALRASLATSAVRRFLQLRMAAPAGEIPQYSNSAQHLKGLDARLKDQVMAEYRTAHADAFRLVDLDEKKFSQTFANKIRQAWDRLSNTVWANYDINDNGGLEHPPPGEDLRLPQPKDAKGPHKATKSRNGWAVASYGCTQLIPTGPSASITDLSAAAYDRRLLSLSSLVCAWSPAVRVGSSAPFYSVLAVGTKEGRVWLWRCTHLQSCSLPGPPNVEQESFRRRMDLIGCLPTPHQPKSSGLAWAQALAWVEVPLKTQNEAPSMLLLAIGYSDGSVVLWGTDAGCVVHASSARAASEAERVRQGFTPGAPDPPVTLTQLGFTTVVPADHLTITSLDAAVRRGTVAMGLSATSIQVTVAVGKSMGVVQTWLSGVIDVEAGISTSTRAVSDLFQSGQVVTPLVAPSPANAGPSDGPHTVTGVSLGMDGDVLTACFRDGQVSTWTLPTLHAVLAAATLRPCPPPTPSCKRRSKDIGFGAFGVATSPGGLFVAVARWALPPGIEFIKQLQVWQKVTLGYVQLDRYMGPGATLPDALKAIQASCMDWVDRRLPPAALWDVVHAADLLGIAPSAVAGPLESAFLQEVSRVEAVEGRDRRNFVPSIISDATWRGLQAAVAVRARYRLRMEREIPAGTMDQSNQINSNDEPNKKEKTVSNNLKKKAAVDVELANLERAEFWLLQRHMEELLRINHDPGSKQSRLLAADAVVANIANANLMDGMFSLATRAYIDNGETPPGRANGFAVPERDGGALLGGCRVAVGGGSVAATLGATFKEEGQVVHLDRCPETLQVALGHGHWSCRGCRRAYLRPTTQKDGEPGAACVICGSLLGPACPDFILTPPCM